MRQAAKCPMHPPVTPLCSATFPKSYPHSDCGPLSSVTLECHSPAQHPSASPNNTGMGSPGGRPVRLRTDCVGVLSPCLTRCPYLCSDVAWSKHQKMCTAAKPFRPAGTGLGKESLSTKLEPGLIGGTQHARMVLPEAGERLRDRVGPAAATYEVSWPDSSFNLPSRAFLQGSCWQIVCGPICVCPALATRQVGWPLQAMPMIPSAAHNAYAGNICVPAAAIVR